MRAKLVGVAMCIALLHVFGAHAEPAHRALIRSVLKDPDSAKFADDRQSARGANVWCGTVNAKNSFGGYGGPKRYIVFLADRDFNVESASDDRFAGRWRLYCE